MEHSIFCMYDLYKEKNSVWSLRNNSNWGTINLHYQWWEDRGTPTLHWIRLNIRIWHFLLGWCPMLCSSSSIPWFNQKGSRPLLWRRRETMLPYSLWGRDGPGNKLGDQFSFTHFWFLHAHPVHSRSLNRYNSVLLNRVQSGTLDWGYLQYYSGLKVIPVHCVDLELCSPLSNRGSWKCKVVLTDIICNIDWECKKN